MTLQERYAQPWRHFHTWDHVERLQRAATWYYGNWSKVPTCVKTAIVYHDAVYIPGANDNEEKSNALFWAQWKGNLTDKALASRAILRTKTHEWKPYGDISIMLSCDLVSLAAPWDVFVHDVQNVMREYLYAYDEAQVQQGRLDFYEGMLKREHIYPHPHFQRTHERKARENLYRALMQGKAGMRVPY